MKKRSFIAALAMLVVSAIVLTSATFAWFSMGSTVKVSQFSANVSEADGLLIGTSAQGTFATSVTLEQIRTAADADLLVPDEDGEIQPVSSNGTVSNGKLSFVSGFLNNDGNLETSVAGSGTYYQLPIYIKYSGTEATTIYLTGTTVTKGTDSNDAYKAVRIATNKPTTNWILAPASDTNSFKAVTTTGVSQPEVTLSNVTKQANSTNLSFTLNPGTVTKVLVYVWLEGTDPSCTDDDAAGGNFTVDLVFTKASA